MSQFHLLTQLKNQVENKRNKNYQNIKDLHNNKYYELYLNKIVFIQKQWRRYLVCKGLKLQRLAFRAVNNLSINKQTHDALLYKLHMLKIRKRELQNTNPNNYVEGHKKQLENQLKASISSVLQGADRYAKIKAFLQSEMMSYKQILKENDQLKKVCKEGTLMAESLREKNERVCKKIKSLRGIIAEQKTDIMLLKQKQENQKDLGLYLRENKN